MEIESEVFGEDNALESELVGLSNDEVRQRIRAFDNEVRIMKSDMNRIKHEAKEQMAHVKDNKETVKMNIVVSANSFHVFSFCFLPLLDISGQVLDRAILKNELYDNSVDGEFFRDGHQEVNL